MRRLVLFIIVCTLGLVSFQPVRAQTAPTLDVTDTQIKFKFGSYLDFSARINLKPVPNDVSLIFHAQGESESHTIPIQLDADGNTSQHYDATKEFVRPFSLIRFLYQVKLPSGEILQSKEYFFRYEDNRFTWNEIGNDQLTIHWYKGDQAFGNDAFNIARKGVEQINKLLLVSPSNPIDIYIYDTSADLNTALEMGGVRDVGGHASPDLRLAVVSIASGLDYKIDMERKIPHELAHIVTYDLMGKRYTDLPVWLREGIATQSELTANADYPRALTQASEKKTLVPIADLCGAFPPESGRAFLAYAQAQSFTSYIVDKYGQTGLLALTSAYGDGLDCEQGMRRALGVPLSQVEADWRTGSLGENPGLTAFTNLFPYLAIVIVLLVVSFSNGFTFSRTHHE